PEPGPYAQP
nr:Chain B, Peptide [synthetic construct]